MRFFHGPYAFLKNLMMSWTALKLVKVCHAVFTAVTATWMAWPVVLAAFATACPAAESVFAVVCAAFLQTETASFKGCSVGCWGWSLEGVIWLLLSITSLLTDPLETISGKQGRVPAPEIKMLVLSEVAWIADFCVYSFEPWWPERADGAQALLSSSFARGRYVPPAIGCLVSFTYEGAQAWRSGEKIGIVASFNKIAPYN